tara:strand:- start:167 stop:697 length:531 start_codon:yes stop_codon:yes gene_type:complete
MAKTKKKTTRTSKKPKTTRRRTSTRKKSQPISKEPEYMIQVNDPTGLRKDLLESLRETIIFMQGHESLRKIQEEKVVLFTQLKLDVKELNDLIEKKLRKLLPRGKIKEIAKADSKKPVQQQVRIVKTVGPAEKSIEEMDEDIQEPKPQQKPRVLDSGLDELEKQLQDIESQLGKIQ